MYLKAIIVALLILILSACSNSVDAEYNKIKVKELILVDEKGNEYTVKVKNDSLSSATIKLEKSN